MESFPRATLTFPLGGLRVQPHGLQRLGWVGVVDKAPYLSVAPRHDLRVAHLARSATRLEHACALIDDYGSVPHLVNLLEIPAQPGKDRSQVVEVPSHAIGTGVGPSFHGNEGGVHFKVRMDKADNPVDVVPVEHLKELPYDRRLISDHGAQYPALACAALPDARDTPGRSPVATEVGCSHSANGGP